MHKYIWMHARTLHYERENNFSNINTINDKDITMNIIIETKSSSSSSSSSSLFRLPLYQRKIFCQGFEELLGHFLENGFQVFLKCF